MLHTKKNPHRLPLPAIAMGDKEGISLLSLLTHRGSHFTEGDHNVHIQLRYTYILQHNNSGTDIAGIRRHRQTATGANDLYYPVHIL